MKFLATITYAYIVFTLYVSQRPWMWRLSESSLVRKIYQVYLYENPETKGDTHCNISVPVPFPETIFLQCSDGL